MIDMCVSRIHLQLMNLRRHTVCARNTLAENQYKTYRTKVKVWMSKQEWTKDLLMCVPHQRPGDGGKAVFQCDFCRLNLYRNIARFRIPTDHISVGNVRAAKANEPGHESHFLQ